jgi:hypothetical protein
MAPLLVGASVLAIAPGAHAEQFVLLDVTFTFTKADADNTTPSKSHYYVKADRLNPNMPVDWTQPIDYRNGRVHVRTEVMDKPAGSAETRWTLCYIARKGIDAGYGCSNTAAYKEEGVWEFEQGMTEWWQNDNIDWTAGIKQMDLVMKDNKGVFAHTMPDPERWFPTTLRITMIQVSAGSTYDETQVPNLPSGGGTGGSGGQGSGGSAGASENAGGGGATTGGTASDPVSGGSSTGGAPATTGGGGALSSAPGGAAGTPSIGNAVGGASSNNGGQPPTSAGVPNATTNAEGATDDASGCSLGRARTAPSGLVLLGLCIGWVARRRRRARVHCAA